MVYLKIISIMLKASMKNGREKKPSNDMNSWIIQRDFTATEEKLKNFCINIFMHNGFFLYKNTKKLSEIWN